jgi:hypothetical protein
MKSLFKILSTTQSKVISRDYFMASTTFLLFQRGMKCGIKLDASMAIGFRTGTYLHPSISCNQFSNLQKKSHVTTQTRNIVCYGYEINLSFSSVHIYYPSFFPQNLLRPSQNELTTGDEFCLG